MKVRKSTPWSATISILFLVAAIPLCAQDQINLGDGLFNAHFNGHASPVVTLLIPSIYYSGGVYYMANGSATGTGHLQSSGNYTVSSASNAPFYLIHNPDDSFTVVQTSPVNFSYASPQGTLTGLLWFGSVSKTDSHLYSTMTGTLTSPGGSFAGYFANGGNLTITLGLNFPLQLLWQTQGFAAVEFQSGTMTPASRCAPLTQGYWKNHTGAWQDGQGLTLGTNFYNNSQLETLLQTPVRGDASLDLAHQLIAALLNIANGTTGIPVQATILDANDLIGAGTLPEHVAPSSPLGQQMEGDASVLDNYNSGGITTACSQ
ncbi:MAG TPA: hypothetical protein VKV05_10395 [Terriglobales bacterium]|nr:hypothetical protein [Terriglobales bacterium]